MKSSKVEWKVERLFKMSNDGKINFDIVIQRKDDIWDTERKCMLIHSILVGYSINAVFATKEKAIYHVLDGKQRLTSVFSFINEEFTLSDNTPKVGDTEIKGLKFTELPEEFQAKIWNYSITVNKMEDISNDEIEVLFTRLNNGMPLRKIEITRAILGGRVLKFVTEVASMPFFAQKVSLSKKMRQHYVDQELILQILALIDNEGTGFSGAEIENLAKKLHDTDIQASLRAKVQNACFYLNEAFLKRQRFLKKVNIPMIFKVVLDIGATKTYNITPREFGEWAQHFFANVPSEYTKASLSGSASKEKVQRRLTIMTQAFHAYFDIKARHQAEGSSDDSSTDAPGSHDEKEAI